MVLVKCQRCFGSAEGETFEIAITLIDHAVGRSRGVGCNGHPDDLKEIKTESHKPKVTPAKKEILNFSGKGVSVVDNPVSKTEKPKTIDSKCIPPKKTTKVSSK